MAWRPRSSARAAMRAGLMHAAAGTQAGAPPWSPARRPLVIPINAFRRTITVPIGNDGIAAPALVSAGGAAVAFCGPSGVGATWAPAQAQLYTSVGPLDPAQCALYVGPIAGGQYQAVAGLQGGGSQFALGGYQLDPGWLVWAVWSNGTPGSTAHLVVTGSKTALIA